MKDRARELAEVQLIKLMMKIIADKGGNSYPNGVPSLRLIGEVHAILDEYDQMVLGLVTA